MKVLSILVGFAVSSVVALAGSFGGPAPFSDGSPLSSGTDGVYQATARGVNATGVISFAYSGGSQTTFAPQNDWSFFVEGQVVEGATTATISDGNIDGILDGTSVNLNEDAEGQIQFPLVFISAPNTGSGTFTADLDFSDATSQFTGDGVLTPAAPNVTEITIVNTVQGSSNIFFAGGGGGISATNFTITNGGGNFLPVSFTVRGTRTSTTPTVLSSEQEVAADNGNQ